MAPIKRHAYDAEFKLKAISHAAEHGNRATARGFNINESMVRKWRKQQDDLRQVKKTRQSFRGNTARWLQLEDKLEQWVVEQRAVSRSVGTTTIRMKATALASELNINEFKGGTSWCFRFMKRRYLSTRTRTTVSQQPPKDYQEKLATSRAYCKNKITEKKIRPEHIVNMDEVPLAFDVAVDKTGARAVNVHTTGVEKSSFTVVLACQANGQKLPPMVIFKRKTLPKENFPAGVVVKANSEGRMDEEKMSEWLREIYVKRPGGFFHTAPSLLIYDSTRSHITDGVKRQVEHTNSTLADISGGLTKELQPLDVGVTRAFKAGLRTAWEQWTTEGEDTFTKTGRRRRTTYATICQWVVNAWADVSVSTVVRAFRKAGVVPELLDNSSDTDSLNDDFDETEPGMLDAESAGVVRTLKAEALQLCHMCQTPQRLSDMVEQESDEGRLEFFCSSRCLMVYRSHCSTAPETESISSEESDVKDVKPPLLSLDSIKEEPIDDDGYRQSPRDSETPDIKDESCLEEVKIGSGFPSAEEPTPTDASESCCACKKALMDGETIYQRKGLPDTFCSTACLSHFHQRKQTCSFCLQALPESRDGRHSSVDEDGTQKDFCSRTCLSSFNCKTVASVETLDETFKSQCSICCRYCISKHEIVLKKIVYKVCSDPCYLRFCAINNMSICELCRRCCETPLVLKTENDRKTLCSEDCVSQFKQKIQTPQQCAMCRTSVPISDMYENRLGDNVIELFCTKGCVTASKIQAVSASGAALNCDKCGRTSVPACHLAMADATIRNFCSLTCAVAFKKTQKDNTSATNSTEASSQTEDSLKPAEKLLCAQCRRVIKTLPKVIYTKEKLIFVCSTICCQDFQRLNVIRGQCEHCKSERIIKDVKKVDGRRLFFCSDGCEGLSLLQLEKKSGQRLASCSYCLSRFTTRRPADDGGAEDEFCCEDCRSKYKLSLGHMAKCDSCGRQGKLKQSLALLGEVKRFCDLKCLLRSCYEVSQERIPDLVPPPEPSPVITSVVSLAEALVRRAKSSSASIQHATTEASPVVNNVASESAEQDQSSVFDIEAEVVGHACTQTVRKEVKNKSMLCTPLVHNKGVSCTVQTVETEAQTDKVEPSVVVLPVPVFVPLPMNMYTQFTPTPVALPIPLPVPIFLPAAEEKSKMLNGNRSVGTETEGGEDGGTETEAGEEDGTETEAEAGEDGGTEMEGENKKTSPPGRLPSSPPEGRKDVRRPGGPPSLLFHKVHRKKGSEPRRTSSEDAGVRLVSTTTHKLQTQWGVDAWKTWIQWRESQASLLPLPKAVRLKEELLRCSAEELSHGLCCFVNEVKQASGEPHGPDGLFYLCLCIQQYLFDNNRTENIFSDVMYSRFSSELAKIMKYSKPSLTGSGHAPSCVDEDFLWECKQLGAFSPVVLLNTLLFFSSKHLGFTSVEQHRRLSFTRIRSFRRTKGSSVTTFLRFYFPNTRSEAQPDGVAAKKRKKTEEPDCVEMTENADNPLRCPVRLYKFYVSKCCHSVRQRSDLFYLRPDHGCVPSSPLWFSPTPLDDATMEAMLVRVLAVRGVQEKD